MKNKVKIIAEVGVNHNGDIKIAKKLIDAAKAADADFVKFQTFSAEKLVSKNATLLKYQFNKKHRSQYELLRSLELKKEEFVQLFLYCKKKNIKFLSTAFDEESALFLKKIGQKIFKIPSGEIDNYPLLKTVSKIATKVFLSTGMSNLLEIEFAIKVLTSGKLKKKDITVFHCTTEYPTEIGNVNLLAMKTIKKKLNVALGYSDHTIGRLTSALAVSLGATIVEKHITLSCKMTGPDHKASMEINDFVKFVKDVRSVNIILGSKRKEPTKNEKLMMKQIRKSIVANESILVGDKFTENNLTTRRPQNGLSPIIWKKIIGKKSKKNYLCGDLIKKL
jgi:N,N'-diacetyllegionaminate synthase